MKKILIVLILLLAAGAGYYFLRPLFVDDVVEEDFPVDLISPDDPNFIQLPSEEELDQMSDEAKEALELSITEKMADLPQSESMDDAMPDNSASQPRVLSSGSFVDGDAFHKGSGDASVYQLADGSNLLRLENFEVTNGPDLYVYLVGKQNPSKADVEENYYSLGRLKGNKGNQNYEIPAEVNLADYESVVIWCQAFSVLFSTANLS